MKDSRQTRTLATMQVAMVVADLMLAAARVVCWRGFTLSFFLSFLSGIFLFLSFQILSANNVIFTFITIPSFTSTLPPTQASKMTTHQPDTTILIGRVVESAATDPSPSAAVTWTLIRALRRRRAGPPTTGRTRLTRSNPRKKPRPQRKKLIYSTLTSLLPRPPKSRTSGEICRRGREEVG